MNFEIEKITASNNNTTSVVKLVNKQEVDRGILGKKVLSLTYYMGGLKGTTAKVGDKLDLEVADFEVTERPYDTGEGEVMCKWLHERRG